MNLENLRKVDSQVAEQIDLELKRQQENIELIASENFTSLAVMEACGSVLTNKYAEGKPHKRYYNGCDGGKTGSTNAEVKARVKSYDSEGSESLFSI